MAPQSWLDNALDTVSRNMLAADREPLGYRKNGRPIWPMFGAEDVPPAPPAPAPTPPAPAPTPPAPAPAPPDLGFPADTPVVEMTAAQQAAYWKHQSRRHEDRSKAFGDLTAEQLKELRDKAKKHDDIEHELMSDKDKAVADAKSAARTEAIDEVTPEVISAKLDAAAARAGVSEESLAEAIKFIDSKKFLTADGKVDADKVKAFVGSISPDRGNGNNNGRQGPSGAGTGRHGTHQTGTAADRGRAEAEKRFGKKPA